MCRLLIDLWMLFRSMTRSAITGARSVRRRDLPVAILVILLAGPYGRAGFAKTPSPPDFREYGSSGSLVGDPVNLANGNWFHTSPDLSVLTRGIKLQFIRYYNTLDPNRSSLGRGWRHSYDRSIELLPGEKLLILHLPDGEREVFEDAGGGRFLGDESRTVILRQPSRYMEHALDRTVFYYDATGRWTRAEHPSGFSGRLTARTNGR